MEWEQLTDHKLTIYSTPWCADCRRLKQHLTGKPITYTEIDIDADPAAAKRLQQKTGRQAIPFVEFDDGEMIRGWHAEAPGSWDESIFLKEAAEAIGAGE
ncbi:MAG: glutaredoxin family protein [Lentisphaerae bacterium]|jgi:mycoredoxin|nr:glutaredoxin family protein [Lentisphaerota bacterium]MBT4816600.1 glutaredoxin family protein [Lentisphaerota bacterium]MBT5610952.1 glutaredoxin family protein [Lentisphaerota bacterium]MBT7053636.1 glutaredoxin family protein [Lentisphaerota bacterium]MBT7842015.1 glutaredoxin family protein [Lentisphaerota bacterium]